MVVLSCAVTVNDLHSLTRGRIHVLMGSHLLMKTTLMFLTCGSCTLVICVQLLTTKDMLLMLMLIHRPPASGGIVVTSCELLKGATVFTIIALA